MATIDGIKWSIDFSLGSLKFLNIPISLPLGFLHLVSPPRGSFGEEAERKSKLSYAAQ